MNINLAILTSIASLAVGLQTVKAQALSDQELKNLFSFPVDDIMKAKAQVDKYTPEGQRYLVDEAGQDWLKRAVSLKRREEWLKTTEFWAGYGPETPQKKKYLYDAFDELKASAAKKLPNYLPPATYFAFHDAQDEHLLSAAISNLNEAKVFKIGTEQSDWAIDKDRNNYPLAKYKRGHIWAKYSQEWTGHSYCVLLHVNVIQNYAGGGNYSASYGKLVGQEICGCPK